MSESPEPLAAAPQEDAPGWAATRWEPEPDVEPLPVQRYASDPLVPGWGIDEPGLVPSAQDEPAKHVAPPASGADGDNVAPSLDEPAEAATPASPDRTMAWVVGGAVLIAAVVFLAIVVGQNLVTGSVQQQVDRLAGVKVATQLAAAGHAMDLYRGATGTYPADVAALSDYGFRAQDGVSVQLVPIGGSDYCLAGGPTGAAPTSWYSSATGVTQTPCGQ